MPVIAASSGLGVSTVNPLATAGRALSFWDLLAIGGLILVGLLYLVGTIRMHARGVRPRPWQLLSFAVGWAAGMVAILPPLDDLSLVRFSLHMLQHELIMLVEAPLLVASRPLATCLWALPARWRLRAAAPLQGGWAGSLSRVATLPVVAWAAHGAVIWAWHLPPLYQWAVGNEAVHAAQHAMFLGTSLVFWWGLICGRYGRAGYGAAVFYVFTTAMHTGLLGALLTFARVSLYPVYMRVGTARGIDVIADQQAAGLLMWIGAGTLFTLVGIALFAAWLGNADRRGRALASRIAR